ARGNGTRASRTCPRTGSSRRTGSSSPRRGASGPGWRPGQPAKPGPPSLRSAGAARRAAEELDAAGPEDDHRAVLLRAALDREPEGAIGAARGVEGEAASLGGLARDPDVEGPVADHPVGGCGRAVRGQVAEQVPAAELAPHGDVLRPERRL